MLLRFIDNRLLSVGGDVPAADGDIVYLCFAGRTQKNGYCY